MSATVPQLHKFVVFAPDKTDEGAFQRRLSVRTKHLARSSEMHDTGLISMSLDFSLIHNVV